jgi:hypothetical protein
MCRSWPIAIQLSENAEVRASATMSRVAVWNSILSQRLDNAKKGRGSPFRAKAETRPVACGAPKSGSGAQVAT